MQITLPSGALAVLLLLLPPAVRAQGLFEEAIQGEGSTEVDGDVQRPSYELNGYLRAAYFAGKAAERDAAETKTGYGEAALKLRARTGQLGDGFGELRFRRGYDGEETNAFFDLREAYANCYLGPVDLRFGHQIIAWGRADALNPTDNITPKDMSVRSADEDDRRSANLALRLVLDLAPLKIETVWVPFFAPSRFPALSLPGSMSMLSPDYPDADLDSGTGAGRLHIETPAFEASASYLVGHATFPGLAYHGYTPPAGGAPGVIVAFQGYRHQVVGIDFAATLGDWLGLRGEAAYRHTFDYEGRDHVPRPDLQYVVGLDRELAGQVMVILQYAGRRVLDWDEPIHGVLPMDGSMPPPEQLAELQPRLPCLIQEEVAWKNRVIAGQAHPISHQVVGRVEWKLLHETLSLQLLGMWNLTSEETMVHPKVVYSLDDALSLSLGADIYSGPDDTLFGMVDESLSAGFMELRASF